MKYTVTVGGESHRCQLFVGFVGKPEADATPADLIAALKANAAACGEVTAAMGWVTDQALAVTGERAEQAERSLATVTAERDAAKYWLAAHKAASEALVDPVTGHGFFMLIGKGDDGADGWFYTFGGPLDSYTLCERSDDQDPHFVYFQRERYDHDRGCWIDGCEVVEPVLAPDECSVAPYCLEDVTEERDALKRERDEARATNRDNLAMWEVERDALKAKLAEAERENLTLRNRIGIDRTSWHEAEAEVKVLRAQLAKTARERDDAMTLAEERRDYARAQNAKLSVECDDLRAQLTAVERERDEAHAALRDCATRLGNGSAVSPKASHAFHCAVATEVGIVVPALRAQLAKTEAVVEAALAALDAALESARGLDHEGHGSASFSRIFPEDTYPIDEKSADAFVKTRMRLWFDTWIVRRVRAAATELRAYDAHKLSAGSGAATPEGGHAAPTGGPMPPPEPAGSSLEATRDLQAPATRAELEELRREVLETVADVCLRADDNAQAPWPWPLTRLGAELRRRVERLEGG